MTDKWIVLVVNRFENVMDAASGPYTEKDALSVLKDIHQDIVDEWEEDETYTGAILDDSELDSGSFFIKWADGTITDYTLLKLENGVKS